MPSRIEPSPPVGGLWEHANELYALGGVARQCLLLQDEHGLDVCVVLACLWHATRGGMLDAARLGRLLTTTETARARVAEIRALRRRVGSDRELDPAWTPVYERLKATELAAERVVLERLETCLREPCPDPPVATDDRPAAAAEALRLYAETQGAAPTAVAGLDALVRAAFA